MADLAVNLPPAAASSQQRCRQTDRRRTYARIFRCAGPALRPSVIVRNTRQIHRAERRHQFARSASSRTERKQSPIKTDHRSAREGERGSKEGSFGRPGNRIHRQLSHRLPLPLFTLIGPDRPSSVTRSAVYSRVGPLVAGPTLTLLADGSSPGGVAAYRLNADLKWEGGIQPLESPLRRSCLHH